MKILTQMAQEKKITVRQYNRGLVKLAWSLIEVESPVTALGLLAAIPSEFYAVQLPEDGQKDEDLTRSAEGISAWLTARGHVDPDALHPMLMVRELAKA